MTSSALEPFVSGANTTQNTTSLMMMAFTNTSVSPHSPLSSTDYPSQPHPQQLPEPYSLGTLRSRHPHLALYPPPLSAQPKSHSNNIVQSTEPSPLLTKAYQLSHSENINIFTNGTHE
jgi:hypothetical protein